MAALNFETIHSHRAGFEESIGDIWRLYNDLELALRQSPTNPNARRIVFRLYAEMIGFARQLTALQDDMKEVLFNGKEDKIFDGKEDKPVPKETPQG